MKIKKIIPIFLILITLGCGFTPMYLDQKEYNFSIDQTIFAGDRVLNNSLKTKLKKLKKESVTKKFTLSIETTYEKNILTKDATGKITNYELVAEIEYIINPNNKKLKFIKKRIMESEEDKFEEKKYEKIIKQDFSSYFYEKLISELNTL
jgi:hypothetical protein